MPKAVLIIHRKRHFADGAIAEVKVWQVPVGVRGSDHAFRYSLFHGLPGQGLIGCDNETGKIDHRHHGDREEPYEFKGIRSQGEWNCSLVEVMPWLR